MDGIENFTGRAHGRERLLRELRIGLRLVLSLPALETQYPLPGSKKYHGIIDYLSTPQGNDEETGWIAMIGWTFLHNLGILSGPGESQAVTLGWFNEWQFGQLVIEVMKRLGYESAQSNRIASMLRILIEQQNWFSSLGQKTIVELFRDWLGNSDIQRFLDVHRFEGVLYYNQEYFEALIWGLAVTSVVDVALSGKSNASLLVERMLLVDEFVQKVKIAEDKSAFQIAKLLEEL